MPEIELVQIFGTYKIYKITVSSLVRKYQIVAESNKIQLKSSLIQFDDRKKSILLFEKGFCFNFGNGKVQQIGLLDQIFIFSIFQRTQHEELKEKIKLVTLANKETISTSDELIEVIGSAESIQYFCELVLALTSEWKI